MNYEELTLNEVKSNIRAEDGILKPARWNTLCEGVLIPCGSLIAVLMVMLGVILISGNN
jgi:hypothetical protein